MHVNLKSLPTWLWRLFQNREWQKNSLVGSIFWLLNTAAVFSFVRHLGHGLLATIVISLLWDGITYAVNRLWIWPKRQVSTMHSGARNIATWGVFFCINGSLAWLLMGPSDMSTMRAKAMLGGYGIAMNPVIFVIRDKVIFSQLSIRHLGTVAWRGIRKTDKA